MLNCFHMIDSFFVILKCPIEFPLGDGKGDDDFSLAKRILKSLLILRVCVHLFNRWLCELATICVNLKFYSG